MSLPRFPWLSLGLLLAGCTATGEDPLPSTPGVTPVQHPAPTPLVPTDRGVTRDDAQPALASAPLSTDAPAATPNPAARLYVDALLRERSYDYAGAIELYEEILRYRPGYLDASERRNTLHAFVELADDLYAQAENAPLEEERVLLRMIQVFWPDFEDVLERLDASDG